MPISFPRDGKSSVKTHENPASVQLPAAFFASAALIESMNS